MKKVLFVIPAFVFISCDETDDRLKTDEASLNFEPERDSEEPVFEETKLAHAPEITFGSSEGNAVFILNGRLCKARIFTKDGIVTFLPGPGFPVLDESGRFNEYLAEFFSRLDSDSRKTNKVGLCEIELAVDKDVSEDATDKFCNFLKQRGIKIINS